MKLIRYIFSFKAIVPTIVATGLLVGTLNAAPPDQPPMDPAIHAAHVAAGTMPPDAPATGDATKGDPALAQQISGLRAKVAQLEAALPKAESAAAAPPAGAAMPGMPGPASAASPAMDRGAGKMKPGGQMGGMVPGGSMPTTGTSASPAPSISGMGGSRSMMDKMMSTGGAAEANGAPMSGGSMPAPSPASAMSTPEVAMKMGGMDKMKMAGMMGMAPNGGGGGSGAMPPSTLPGFPGAAHLYHTGATDFFLDDSSHITLTTEQKAALNKAKEEAFLAKSTSDGQAEQAEQELWMLTAADQPDLAKIEAKLHDIADLGVKTRLAYIKAVGAAASLLTDEQRKALSGIAPAAPVSAGMPGASMPTPAVASPTPGPMAAGGMKDM